MLYRFGSRSAGTCYDRGMDAAEMLAAGYTRETTIRRDAGGRWYQDGTQLEHPGLCRSFDSWIDRAPDGRFCLQNNINWAFIEIEGPPYVVRSLRSEGPDLVVTLSGERTETLDLSTLRVDELDAIWCDVRDGRVPARFDSHAAMQLGEFMVESGDSVAIQFGERTISPPRVRDGMDGWTPERGHVESRP